MSVLFATLNQPAQSPPFDGPDPTLGAFVAILCDQEHTLIYEEPPTLAIQQFFGWSLNGLVEIYGGQAGRQMSVDVWIHDASFATLQDIDAYLFALDQKAGAFGTLRVVINPGTPDAQVLDRPNTRFLGFKRLPFNGQDRPEPLPAIGTKDPTTYGKWHIAGELHFFQLTTDNTGGNVASEED